MPTVKLSPVCNIPQFFDNNGQPLNGGKVNTYFAGSFSSQATTYTTSAGDVANDNPMILDSSGRPPQAFWLIDDVVYNFVVTDALDVFIWNRDNITGTTGGSGGGSQPITQIVWGTGSGESSSPAFVWDVLTGILAMSPIDVQPVQVLALNSDMLIGSDNTFGVDVGQNTNVFGSAGNVTAGNASLLGGNASNDTGTLGGSVYMTAGNPGGADAGGSGGSIYITSGTADNFSGNITISIPDGTGAGARPGNINIIGGGTTFTGDPGFDSPIPSYVNIKAGSMPNMVGFTGGVTTVAAGDGNPNSDLAIGGVGGTLYLYGGSGGKQSGDVIISVGGRNGDFPYRGGIFNVTNRSGVLSNQALIVGDSDDNVAVGPFEYLQPVAGSGMFYMPCSNIESLIPSGTPVDYGKRRPTFMDTFGQLWSWVPINGVANWRQASGYGMPNVIAAVTGGADTMHRQLPLNVIEGSGTFVTYTATMPDEPVQGQSCVISFTVPVTTLTVAANAGQTMSTNLPTTAVAFSSVEFYYIDTQWNRLR